MWFKVDMILENHRYYSFSVLIVFIYSNHILFSMMKDFYSVSITWLDNSDCFNVNNSFKSNMQLKVKLLFVSVTVLMCMKSVAGVQVNMSSDDIPNGNRRLLEECYRRELSMQIRYSWSCIIYSHWWSEIWVILSTR